MQKALLALCLTPMLAACGTSPEPGLYTIGPVPGVVSTSDHYVVKVVKPALAGYLDRPAIMRQTGAYQVAANETVNWAEPLDAMFERVLADDLQQRLPGAIIQTDAGEAAAPVRFIVETNIQQFNQAAGDQVMLNAQMTITDKAAHVQPPVETINRVADTGGSTSSVAAALSSLVGQYADHIIGVMHAQDAATAAPPPAGKDKPIDEAPL